MAGVLASINKKPEPVTYESPASPSSPPQYRVLEARSPYAECPKNQMMELFSNDESAGQGAPAAAAADSGGVLGTRFSSVDSVALETVQQVREQWQDQRDAEAAALVRTVVEAALSELVTAVVDKAHAEEHTAPVPVPVVQIAARTVDPASFSVSQRQVLANLRSLIAADRLCAQTAMDGLHTRSSTEESEDAQTSGPVDPLRKSADSFTASGQQSAPYGDAGEVQAAVVAAQAPVPAPQRFKTAFGQVFLARIGTPESTVALETQQAELMSRGVRNSVDERWKPRPLPARVATALHGGAGVSIGCGVRVSSAAGRGASSISSSTRDRSANDCAQILAESIQNLLLSKRKQAAAAAAFAVNATPTAASGPPREVGTDLAELVRKSVSRAVQQSTNEVRMKLQHQHLLDRQERDQRRDGVDENEVKYYKGDDCLRTASVATVHEFPPPRQRQQPHAMDASISSVRGLKMLVRDDVTYSRNHRQLLLNDDNSSTSSSTGSCRSTGDHSDGDERYSHRPLPRQRKQHSGVPQRRRQEQEQEQAQPMRQRPPVPELRISPHRAHRISVNGLTSSFCESSDEEFTLGLDTSDSQ
jgi:hypothetical protein